MTTTTTKCDRSHCTWAEPENGTECCRCQGHPTTALCAGCRADTGARQ